MNKHWPMRQCANHYLKSASTVEICSSNELDMVLHFFISKKQNDREIILHMIRMTKGDFAASESEREHTVASVEIRPRGVIKSKSLKFRLVRWRAANRERFL